MTCPICTNECHKDTHSCACPDCAPARTLQDCLNDLDRIGEEITAFAEEVDDRTLELFVRPLDAAADQIRHYTQMLKARGITDWTID